MQVLLCYTGQSILVTTVVCVPARLAISMASFCGIEHTCCRIDDPRQVTAAQQLGLLPMDTAETLVLYTYSNSDLEYERNLHFFVQHGMAEGDGCDYIIIVQEVKIPCFYVHAFNSCTVYMCSEHSWTCCGIKP